jgi:hypothetical protein
LAHKSLLMKKRSLLFTMLLLAVAAKSSAQTDLIARIHFAGTDQISADANHLAFTNLFSSPEALALESQTLDKLSHVPGAAFKSKLAPGVGDAAAQLRPLLDDLLESEWVLEMRDATNGSPEYALAIRLNDGRAQLWSKNLAAVLQSWTGMGVTQGESGNWGLKKHQPPNLFQFSRSGDWVMIDCGQDQLSLREEILGSFVGAGLPAKETNWLSADLNWPRLAQLFPALAGLDFPKIQIQVIGRDGSLRLAGRLTLTQPLPPLEKWRVPTNAIRQPFDSFTAARGIAPWLQRQDWAQAFVIQPPPDQIFIWALPQIPFQTFAAAPVPDADAALAQLDRNLSAHTNWQGRFFMPLAITMTNREISFGDLPFISPFVRAVSGPAGDFLFGGFFPNLPKSPPLPPELIAHLNQPNLVYYHWEISAERLKELPQMSQLVLLLTRHEQLDGQSAAAKWLDRIGPALGSSITEVTQTAPSELTFKRAAPGGLTAIELLAFANWLEAPQFPAFDLRLPPQRIRSGQRPSKPVATPPVSPAPPRQ